MYPNDVSRSIGWPGQPPPVDRSLFSFFTAVTPTPVLDRAHRCISILVIAASKPSPPPPSPPRPNGIFGWLDVDCQLSLALAVNGRPRYHECRSLDLPAPIENTRIERTERSCPGRSDGGERCALSAGGIGRTKIDAHFAR